MSLELRSPRSLSRRLSLLLPLAAAIFAAFASGATASRGQMAMFQDDQALRGDPQGTLQQIRSLGAREIRLFINWQAVAPNANSRRRPRSFDAANPAAYPAGNWQIYDTIIRLAQQNGIGVDLDVSGGAPMWATGPHPPRGNKQFHQWEPSASQFALFVRAVGTRYSGGYKPAGAGGALPRVSIWSIWNEPDYGPSLAPQGVYPNHLTVENSPRLYRNLVDAAWGGLHRSGHGGDTFLFGEVAPRGESNWGVFSGMRPLVFLRALYCLNSSYRQLRGSAASLRGCPTSAAGSRRFRSQHPALFSASGFSDHPYMRWYRPNREQNPDPVNHLSTSQYSSLGVMGNLERALDRSQRSYGSHRRLPIYDTEFGYITNPPQHGSKYPYVSPATAAYYMNWAEYIHWRNPRLLTYHQYLLRDPLPPTKAGNYGGFASGLETYGGQPKPGYDAYRLPLYMPKTRASRGHSLEVWGCVRPAHFASLDTGGAPQAVRIQFAPTGSNAFTTIADVPITDPSGYFDTRVVFPRSGTVILSWSYPSGQAVSSRSQPITVH